MKKLLLSILFLTGTAYAAAPSDFNYIPASSFTDVEFLTPIQFSSAPLNWVGVTITSPAPNSYLVIYRSTSPTFTANLSTFMYVGADYLPQFNGPTYVPMFESNTSSYTYISKVGTSKLVLWYRCMKRGSNIQGICPGISWDGERE